MSSTAEVGPLRLYFRITIEQQTPAQIYAAHNYSASNYQRRLFHKRKAGDILKSCTNFTRTIN